MRCKRSGIGQVLCHDQYPIRPEVAGTFGVFACSSTISQLGPLFSFFDFLILAHIWAFLKVEPLHQSVVFVFLVESGLLFVLSIKTRCLPGRR
jgi:hypothetical protein